VQRKFKKMLIKNFSLFEPKADDILWEMMLDIKSDDSWWQLSCRDFFIQHSLNYDALSF